VKARITVAAPAIVVVRVLMILLASICKFCFFPKFLFDISTFSCEYETRDFMKPLVPPTRGQCSCFLMFTTSTVYRSKTSPHTKNRQEGNTLLKVLWVLNILHTCTGTFHPQLHRFFGCFLSYTLCCGSPILKTPLSMQRLGFLQMYVIYYVCNVCTL
jgi:hypothetical protein